jgi:hypothetical protein
MVSTLAFHAGDQKNQQIFNFPLSPSDPSGLIKPSFLKLATFEFRNSGITYPSDT